MVKISEYLIQVSKDYGDSLEDDVLITEDEKEGYGVLLDCLATFKQCNDIYLSRFQQLYNFRKEEQPSYKDMFT